MSSLQEKTEKLIVYGKSQLSSKGVESTATTIRGVLDDVANIQAGGVAGTGQYLVQVVDYDGTVLKSDHLNTGDTFTLPEAPTHDKLVFQGWSSPYDIVDNKVTVDNQDITIGPTYTTASGLSEFDITLTKVTGLAVTFKMVGNKNWGDGTSDGETTHTYAAYGNYTITCDGTTLPQYIMGQTTSVKNYTLTAVRLGRITAISSRTFINCYSLETITIPIVEGGIVSLGTHTFSSCISLKCVVIPYGLTKIGSNTFGGFAATVGCISLTYVVIPSSVTSIDNYAFGDCRSLTSITIPKSVTSIGNNAFSGYSSGTIGCASLKSIVIPDNVTSIKNGTFGGCYDLNNITIPESVTSIGSSAFNNCYSLTSITIPNAVTSIESKAFNNCYSITKYDFSTATAVPTLVNTDAFSNINNICKIIVPDALYDEWITATNWTTYADYIYKVSEVYPPKSTPANYFNIHNSTISGFSPEGQALYDSGELTELVLPSSYSLDESGNVVDGNDYAVTSINFAFNGCSNLTSITIPGSITNIGGYSFANCSGLTSIIISSGVTSINYYAFSNCSGLTDIVIPSSVNSIGKSAFEGCTNLTNMTILATTPPTLEMRDGISSATTTIYIPAGTLGAYQNAANWNNFASKFVEMEGYITPGDDTGVDLSW